jgi:hypothetical protein
MTPHCKVYMNYFDYTTADFIPCEVCSNKSIDIHHIFGRGKGKDVISNLCALCREHHNDCHNEIITKEEMSNIHKQFLMKC